MSDGGWAEFTKGMNMAQKARAAELAEERDYDQLIRSQRHETPASSGILSGLRIDQSVYPGNLSYAHNVALNAVVDVLRSQEVLALVAEAIESRAEGMLSPRECQLIAVGIIASLVGEDNG